MIAKIRDSATSFDTSTDAMITLKKAGVGDAVIRAMINPSASPASGAVGQEVEPGVYLEEDGALVQLERTIVAKTKTAKGFVSVKLKAIVQARQAKRRTSQGRAVFHFYFGMSGGGLVFPVPNASTVSAGRSAARARTIRRVSRFSPRSWEPDTTR